VFEQKSVIRITRTDEIHENHAVRRYFVDPTISHVNVLRRCDAVVVIDSNRRTCRRTVAAALQLAVRYRVRPGAILQQKWGAIGGRGIIGDDNSVSAGTGTRDAVDRHVTFVKIQRAATRHAGDLRYGSGKR